MNRRKLTQEEQQAAQNLSQLWATRKKLLGFSSQESLAHHMGWKSQSAVNQYLTGKIPISLEAGLKFAEALRVLPGDINPTWSKYNMGAPESLEDKLGKASDIYREAVSELLELDEDKVKAVITVIKTIQGT